MKIKWDEDEFEVDDEKPEVKDKPTTDSLDKYNEEMARDAVSSLFDDDEPEGADPVVVGFDKPTAKTGTRGRAAEYEDDKPHERGDTGEAAPARRRDRSREVNPVPKPAVRYAAAPPRERRAVRSAAVHTSEDYEEGEGGVEEEMDAFRKRYKPSAADSAHRTDGQPKPRAERQTPSRASKLYYDDVGGADDEDSVSPLRWVFVAVMFILLCVTVYLAYRVNLLSTQLAEAQAAVEDASGGADITQIQLDNERMVDELRTKDEEIERLEGMLASGQPGVGTPSFSANDPAEGGVSSPEIPGEETPSAQPSTPETYTAVARDNLTVIARKVYNGNDSFAAIDAIRKANNLENDSVSIGQVFVIPPEPAR